MDVLADPFRQARAPEPITNYNILRLPKLSNRMARATILLIAIVCFVNAQFARGQTAVWSLQSGDSLTLSSNTCAAGYTECQATCGEGYSVSLSGSAYTLTSTATSSSLPSDCSCYTIGPATPTSSTWSGSIPVGPGTSVQGSVTETSSTTYKVVLQTNPGPCTLTYTKDTGSSSGVSRFTQTFMALVVGALALVF